MATLIERKFNVNASLEAAWQHLAQVEEWPSWAKHIRRVRLQPKGMLTANTRGAFHLSNGIRTSFKMVEIRPHRSWKWTGKLLWLTVRYDHQFRVLSDDKTELTWIVEAEGFGHKTLGRLFAWQYNKNLDRAIPNLIAEMDSIHTE